METYRREPDSPAWLAYVRVSFLLSLGAVALGLYHLPVDWWTKGYMAMGVIFCVGSAFTLAKTLRDQHEATKLTKKIDDIQTEKILREHALDLNGAPSR